MMAKVCGLTCAADVAVALAAGADLAGFLHHPASPRHCPDLDLARLAGDRAALVVVAPDADTLLALARRAGAAWVQPYLPVPERARAIALLQADGRRVLLPWPDEPDQAALAPDLFLWETSPRTTGLLGGSGQGHPMAYAPPGPFLLGGGLHGAVLPDRLALLPPGLRASCRGFDAASRLESAPGRKDSALVTHFVRTAHDLE
jgi:phosphoribosylanthranilate isomerase